MAVTSSADDPIIEVVRTTPTAVEVVSPTAEVTSVEVRTTVVEVVKPGGTVVNVGAGPELPSNPYEGQIWIKTT